MKKIHGEINRRLARLDFDRILPGFHPFRFALYNDERVCFGDSEIARDERFIGNTAIQYGGEWIAIWNLKGDGRDLDSLTACITHEMFHAYQNETHEIYPDEMIGCFYPRDLDNFNSKYQEDMLLAALAVKFDGAVWREFISARARRLRLYTGAVDYELKTEVIEGMATYAELRALELLAPGLYKGKLDKSISNLRAPERVFDVRLVSYTVGAIIQLIMRENGLEQIDWSKAAVTEAPTQAAPDLTAAFEKHFGEIDGRVRAALARSEKIESSGQTLLAFDPYNVRSSGPYLYHPNFIGCGPDAKTCRFLMGAHITKMKAQTREIEEAWRVKE